MAGDPSGALIVSCRPWGISGFWGSGQERNTVSIGIAIRRDGENEPRRQWVGSRMENPSCLVLATTEKGGEGGVIEKKEERGVKGRRKRASDKHRWDCSRQISTVAAGGNERGRSRLGVS